MGEVLELLPGSKTILMIMVIVVWKVFLSEGIKGWATAGDDFVQWMDGYQADVWANA